MSSPQTKRQKTDNKTTAEADITSLTNNNELAVGALEIVQGQFTLDLQQKNSNLRDLIDELEQFTQNYTEDDWGHVVEVGGEYLSLGEVLREFDTKRKQHSTTNVNDGMNQYSWSVERDEHVFDPHPWWEATRYEEIQGSSTPLYPAFKGAQATGVDALFIALDNLDELKKWRILEMENKFLDQKLINLILEVKSERDINRWKLEYDAPPNYDKYISDIASSNDDKAIFERIEHNLSSMSKDDLDDYVQSSNLDIRAEIYSTDPFYSMCEDGDYATDIRFCTEGIEGGSETLRRASLRFLPQERQVQYDPLLKMENHFLSEKLQECILKWKSKWHYRKMRYGTRLDIDGM